ncbi:hypothetical protein PACTADRAFT_47368 [Pachysolen tannophilus NRRL Y-2460]|uniref:Mitochondrial import inner membrane translocase subunit n=1 Tax=Pachysolen tannophilus NRRL Y-2460 TaxID=669874 RepID=A0A1E4TML1_PACTA|nr:hypothetical protein PACTADRAFT_47368 [Pachysolen tannophilus NRRL Y-2460]
MSELDPQELSRLDEQSKKDIMKFINSENSKSKVQMQIHTFTDMCFKKCISGPVTTGQLIGNEEQCINNCLNRYLDVNIKVVQQLQNVQK